MIKTIGILAHVDAGKTSLSEQILYHTKAIRNRGRVDHKNTFLDNYEIERKRGITVFSKIARFFYNENEYFLVDTPGHIDFSGQMERSLDFLDYAILVVSGVQKVQSHTSTVFKLLKKKNIPTFIFINKEVLGGVLSASQRVLLILPCHSNDNEKGFIIEMYLDSISI